MISLARIPSRGARADCLDAIRRGDVQLDRDGKLDDLDYFKGLSDEEREQYAGRNVFAFSMSVAAHEVLQLVGLVSGNARVGGKGPQTYHAYLRSDSLTGRTWIVSKIASGFRAGGRSGPARARPPR